VACCGFIQKNPSCKGGTNCLFLFLVQSATNLPCRKSLYPTLGKWRAQITSQIFMFACAGCYSRGLQEFRAALQNICFGTAHLRRVSWRLCDELHSWELSVWVTVGSELESKLEFCSLLESKFFNFTGNGHFQVLQIVVLWLINKHFSRSSSQVLCKQA